MAAPTPLQGATPAARRSRFRGVFGLSSPLQRLPCNYRCAFYSPARRLRLRLRSSRRCPRTR
ncbi:MAG: hypothetical protein EOP70_18085 [Variovorax sp.]|nr:MAG: hypothetical protein EOP70_18085 [Variovorax sp.]